MANNAARGAQTRLKPTVINRDMKIVLIRGTTKIFVKTEITLTELKIYANTG